MPTPAPKPVSQVYFGASWMIFLEDAVVAILLEGSRAAFGDAYCLLIGFNEGRDAIPVCADAVVGVAGITACEEDVADEAGGTVDVARFADEVADSGADEVGDSGADEVADAVGDSGADEAAALDCVDGVVCDAIDPDDLADDEIEGTVDEVVGMVEVPVGTEEEAVGAGVDATTGVDAAATGAFVFICEPAGASFPVKNQMPATVSATAGSVQNQNTGVRRFLPPLTARSTLAHTASEGLNDSSSNFCCTSFSNLGSCIRLIFGDG